MPMDYFGEVIARRYDEFERMMFEPSVVDPAVSFLADLCGDGNALEFGIGTGRIAIPLSARGVHVHGIDLSAAMLAQLRSKPGAERIGTTQGDFATALAPGQYRVVYLAFNTINNLTAQQEQVACFANAAAHLECGGYFVIEVSVPDLQRLPPGETIRPFDVSTDHIGFDEYDIARQGLVSHHITFTNGQVERVSIPFRYVWPAELDLMARIANLSLHARWDNWHSEPFTSASKQHISVWQKPA
jgi:hypothetical protein